MIELGYESDRSMTYDEAVMYCFFYSQDGKNGWRLPSAAEYDEYYELTSSWYHDDALQNHPDESWWVTPVRDL